MSDTLIGVTVVAAVIGFFVLRAVLRKQAYDKRRADLIEKYGEVAAQRILEQKIWQGMTTDQLIESWGNPIDIGRRVHKNKTVETYKYNQTGRNRYASRVTLENGIVVGWDQK